MTTVWKTSKREIVSAGPLVMGILNVTPDSFSDGGKFTALDDAVRRAEAMIEEGADLIDIGGESTRPGLRPVSTAEEIARVIPVVEAVAKRSDTPISVDTSKSEMAAAAMDAGAEIINDISALRFDERIAEIAGRRHAGLVLMHSRGTLETLHSQPAVGGIIAGVMADFARAIALARSHGVTDEHIVLDVGIGFGKTPEQNLELLAKLDNIKAEFPPYPFLIGASRKSFLAGIVGDMWPDQRLGGSIAAALAAVANGAGIVRVHDVRATVQAIRVFTAIGEAG
jgi:dihydropteroate synthase